MKLIDCSAYNPCQITEVDGTYHMVANANTDFICKYEEYIKDSASFFSVEKTGDFTLKAKVTTDGDSAFDAVFVMAREDTTNWIKLALELGVDNRYNVVSVVTNKWSDDSNGELLPSNTCWLRITRKNDFWGLHYSLDGTQWRFVRAFGQQISKSVSVGFGIQAPKRGNCSGTISDVSITDTCVPNFRDGN